MIRQIGPVLAVAFAVAAYGCGSSSTTPSNPAPVNPTFTAHIVPSQEAPTPVTNAESVGSGDATIVFNLTKDAGGNITAATATFNVTLTGLPAGSVVNIAHIHLGAPGVAGGILVNTGLAPGDVTLTNGGASFTKTASFTDLTLPTSIMNNPNGYYFNVHTALNPGGFARGQLVRTQ